MSVILLRLYAWVASMGADHLRSRLRARAVAGKELPGRLGERRGYEQSPRPRGRLIWLHAASVGETMSILPVIAHLLHQAEVTVLVTTGTVTSATLLARRAPELAPPGRLLHRFVPLDVPRWVARFIDHWQPDAAGFVESEIWPNLLRECHRQHIPLLLINARVSPQSFKNWRRLPGVARHLFGLFDQVMAQSDADAERLTQLGARCVTSPGNLKFAAPRLPADPAELERLRRQLAGRPVWLAASTHPGEERIACAVHRALADRTPGLVTVIAPRHPERGAEIAADLAGKTTDLSITRRSLGEPPPPGGIWLADTLGELGLFYRLAPIVFIGRSLMLGGGQNPIEPARLGCAVAVGPLTANFTDAVTTLHESGALEIVPDAAALGVWVAAMLHDPERRRAMGEAGLRTSSRAEALPELVASTLIGMAADRT